MKKATSADPRDAPALLAGLQTLGVATVEAPAHSITPVRPDVAKNARRLALTALGTLTASALAVGGIVAWLVG